MFSQLRKHGKGHVNQEQGCQIGPRAGNVLFSFARIEPILLASRKDLRTLISRFMAVFESVRAVSLFNGIPS
jgi:hypothetical protein